ncbi:calcium-binding protein [Niveispirillum sp.]|uniref:calcium-binding protein n=1 Tax=Niveispirillum sp. TaxID=1917217 RepID=UPI001B686220|nr:calcium-binding protein [Niveispirillum sp.]MBP7335844.1 type I secretion C-terminal target domain-containing protein [Niveispirillum sp.]
MAAGVVRTGTTGDDVLGGTAGDDTITGLAGNDSLSGGDGNDSLTGGFGFDTLDGGNGDDRIDLTGGEFGDIDLARGGAGNDTITSSLGEEQIDGGAGDDTLTAIGGTVAGGAGDDVLTLSHGMAVGGAGRDRFVVGSLGNPDLGQDWSVTISDFAVGLRGDILDLTAILPSLVGYNGGNPFGRYFWLEQSSFSTEAYLRMDRDAAGDQYGTQTLVTFRNVSSSMLNATHFTGGFTPRTGIDNSVGASILGGDGNDTLSGGWGRDTINGAGGDDYLSDKSTEGNVLSGGDGNDTLVGGPGGDLLTGGAGNDTILPGGGYDTVSGGDGNDWIDATTVPSSWGGQLNGDAGDDTITAGTGVDQINGGDGNDALTAIASTINGGAGDDILTLTGGSVTGGLGVDRFIIGNRYAHPYSLQELVITDFRTGAGGDVLDLSLIIPLLIGYKPGDPTATYFRITQYGELYSELTVDLDAAGDQPGYTLARLPNVKVADLVAANFFTGQLPGSIRDDSDRVQNGTSADETLVGGWGNDTINGNDGNDFITDASGLNSLSGGAGNDTIRGGADRDRLFGGDGDDVLTGGAQTTVEGGAGADLISGGTGARLFGGSGSDTLSGAGGAESLEGGDGNDLLQWYAGQYEIEPDRLIDTLNGGAGDDTIRNAGDNDFIFGDDGNDVLISLYGASILDGGAGNDRLEAQTGSLTGGAGADRFLPTGLFRLDGGTPTSTVTITDFSAAEGDVIDLSGILANLWDYQAGKPLSPYVSFVQDGNDLVLMVDADPIDASPYLPKPPAALARLLNTDLSALTKANFAQEIDLVIRGYIPKTVIGGDGSDLLVGGQGNDMLDGGAGIDAARFKASASEIGQNIKIDVIGVSATEYHYRLTDTRPGGEGVDTLYTVEVGIFGDQVIPLRPHPGVMSHMLYDPTQFSESGYLSLYPDVAAAVERGDYASGQAHYLARGQAEGRMAPARLDGTLILFDTNFYLQQNPDVATAIGTNPAREAWAHFSAYGSREGRDPNSLFDTDWYMDTYTDVAGSGMDALTHYVTYGWKEGRDPSRWFDTSRYLAENPDIAAAGINPLAHYLLYGYREGRPLHYTEDLI